MKQQQNRRKSFAKTCKLQSLFSINALRTYDFKKFAFFSLSSFLQTARAWSCETGGCVKIFKGHQGAVTCMATDNTGKILFTGSADSTIKSWNIATGQIIRVSDAEHIRESLDVRMRCSWYKSLWGQF